MRLLTWEGVTRTMGVSLCSGVFLAGFAAALGADARAMGVIGSLPYAGDLLQLAAAQIIAWAGGRKRVFIAVTIASLLIWTALALIAFTLVPSPWLVWAFAVLYGLDAFCASTRFLAWLDWMRDLVPARLRGRYFARRNRIILLAGILLSIPAARLVDWVKSARPEAALSAYGVIFGLAALFIAASIFITRRIHEPPLRPVGPHGLWKSALRDTWNNQPFRRYLIWRFYMNFAIALTSPLLTYYLIRELLYSSTYIALLGVMATLISAATLLLWGKLADRVGNRPALFLVFGIKLLWAASYIFATPSSYVLLVVIYILSAHGDGSVLLHNNMLMKLVPRESATASLGLFNALTMIGSVFAPILGGFIAATLPGRFDLLGWAFTNWQGLILISIVLRFSATLGLIWVQEPKSVPISHLVRVVWRVISGEEQEPAAPNPAEEEKAE